MDQGNKGVAVANEVNYDCFVFFRRNRNNGFLAKSLMEILILVLANLILTEHIEDAPRLLIVKMF